MEELEKVSKELKRSATLSEEQHYELTSTPELLTLAAYVPKDDLVGHHCKERPIGQANVICPSTGEKFLNRTAMACAVRSRIDKWDLMKLQSFCKAKDTVNKTKRLQWAVRIMN